MIAGIVSSLWAWGVDALSSTSERNLCDLKNNLQSWCEEKRGAEEYATRIAVAEKIETCYAKEATELNLSRQGLSSLPTRAISHLKNLKTLDLSHNKLQALPCDAFGEDLQNLEKLNLSHNQLLSYSLEVSSFAICHLKNLKTLDLSSNQLQGVLLDRCILHILGDMLKELQYLEELNLSCNELQELPDAIGDLQNLTTLSVEHNRLVKLPNTIGRLQNLIFFDLSHNELQELPDTFGDLQNLKYFRFAANFQLRRLPETFGNLKNLIDLDLSSSLRHPDLLPITSILRRLQNLKTLNLSGNDLRMVSDVFGDLKSLTNLNLSGNALDILPVFTESLRFLNLSNNRIRVLPPILGRIQNLADLDLSDNQLKRLDACVLRCLTNLEILNLARNQLEDVDALYHLQKLRVLDLSFNKQLLGFSRAVWDFLENEKLCVITESFRSYPENTNDWISTLSHRRDYQLLSDKMYFRRWMAFKYYEDAL